MRESTNNFSNEATCIPLSLIIIGASEQVAYLFVRLVNNTDSWFAVKDCKSCLKFLKGTVLEIN